MKTAVELIAFERRIASLWEAGELPDLVHLAGGNEDALLNVFKHVKPEDWVFASHRSHYHALLKGIPEEKVESEIKSGRSMFLFSKEHNFVTSAILGGTSCMAAGVAWQLKSEGSKAMVWCFLGDGASENGHTYEAALFVDANDLPCRFVIENSGYQVDTDLATRRGGNENLHNPLSNFKCVSSYDYVRVYPHAGSGTKNKIFFNPNVVESRLSKTNERD